MRDLERATRTAFEVIPRASAISSEVCLREYLLQRRPLSFDGSLAMHFASACSLSLKLSGDGTHRLKQ
jgi:uncharacterized membrane protein